LRLLFYRRSSALAVGYYSFGVRTTISALNGLTNPLRHKQKEGAFLRLLFYRRSLIILVKNIAKKLDNAY
jgi:hypothetical protein